MDEPAVLDKPPHRPSILEIARKAGVSPATVSRAFNQPDLLRPETRARIAAVAPRSGFRPTPVGPSLRAARTRTTGLLLTTLPNRSEDRRVGKEGVSTCSSRGGPY